MIGRLLALCSLLLASPVQGCNACIVKEKIAEDDVRYRTFMDVLQLLSLRQVKVIVETGTARHGDSNCRGDGCSTLIWGKWAHENDASVYSVDISLDSVKSAEMSLGVLKENVVVVQADSVEFLRNFNQPIDFLYLDSYDFDYQNPLPSQQHHLNEIIAAEQWLTDDAIVMIDDCDLPHGGKGKLAIAYLLERGWKIVSQHYQVILVQS